MKFFFWARGTRNTGVEIEPSEVKDKTLHPCLLRQLELFQLHCQKIKISPMPGTPSLGGLQPPMALPQDGLHSSLHTPSQQTQGSESLLARSCQPFANSGVASISTVFFPAHFHMLCDSLQLCWPACGSGLLSPKEPVALSVCVLVTKLHLCEWPFLILTLFSPLSPIHFSTQFDKTSGSWFFGFSSKYRNFVLRS